jgi:hypothetical protein
MDRSGKCHLVQFIDEQDSGYVFKTNFKYSIDAIVTVKLYNGEFRLTFGDHAKINEIIDVPSTSEAQKNPRKIIKWLEILREYFEGNKGIDDKQAKFLVKLIKGKITKNIFQKNGGDGALPKL